VTCSTLKFIKKKENYSKKTILNYRKINKNLFFFTVAPDVEKVLSKKTILINMRGLTEMSYTQKKNVLKLQKKN